MRRSAAPSAFSISKKPRFVVPYASTHVASDKENTYLPNKVTEPSTVLQNNQHARSTADVLKLLSDPCASAVENNEKSYSPVCVEKESKGTPQPNKTEACLPLLVEHHDEGGSPNAKFFKGELTSPADCGNINDPMPTTDSQASTLYYSVVWCKRSMKKHKKWEGDAVLIIEGRSAILKDMEGKEIGRGIGYKAKEISDLEEGSTFYIGGKECEIQNQISSADYLSGKCFQVLGQNSAPAPQSDLKKF